MSESDPRRFVHVGLPKAASTLLQNHIFSALDDYLWLGTVATANIGRGNGEVRPDSIFLKDSELRRLYALLLNASEDSFYQQRDAAAALEQELVHKYSAGNPRGVIFSSEFLTSTFFSYGDVYGKARRIHAIWPNATIILVIREQYSMVLSQYADQPFDPRNMSESRALPIDEWLAADRARGKLSLQTSLDYLQLYNTYSQLFGRDNVNVLLFEDIVNDKRKIANQLRAIFDGEIDISMVVQKLGIVENSKPGALFQSLRGLKRRFFPKLHVGTNRNARKLMSLLSGIGPPVGVPDREDVESVLRDRYSQSNKELAEAAGLDLSRYGYIK